MPASSGRNAENSGAAKTSFHSKNLGLALRDRGDRDRKPIFDEKQMAIRLALEGVLGTSR
jgi:hypothetical protein